MYPSNLSSDGHAAEFKMSCRITTKKKRIIVDYTTQIEMTYCYSQLLCWQSLQALTSPRTSPGGPRAPFGPSGSKKKGSKPSIILFLSVCLHDSNKIQTSSKLNIERIYRLIFVTYKCACLLLNYLFTIIQWVSLPHPPQLSRDAMNIINTSILLEPLVYLEQSL